MSNVFKEDLHENKVLRSFQLFFSKSTAGGIVLIIATAIALFWSNSEWYESYKFLWKSPLTVTAFDITLFHHPFYYIVNDGLMVMFFFVVGLEIKRELLIGELSSFRKAMLPVIGAIGGVVGPVLIYRLINMGDPAALDGWAIPMATDIAFALGVLALLGDRVPVGIKVFLAALAIVDDLMAVLVIAFFYTSEIHFTWLYVGAIFAGFMFILNRLKINNGWVYFFFGFGLWYCFLESGIHPTVAGVIGAFMIPARSVLGKDKFLKRTEALWGKFKQYFDKNKSNILNSHEEDTLHVIEKGVERVQSPLHRLEVGIHPYTAFIILPIFALANAGVYLGDFELADLTNKITLGIASGLFFGKIIGVSGAVWIATKVGLASLPLGVKFSKIVAVSALCGIGFTMAIFIAGLSFKSGGSEEDYAKIGILIASTLAAVIGYIIMANSLKDSKS
ncbi:Na+/H+ antiporter NhaA [Candidatus Kapabacteria bacterium]|nr:Na+/H+ antiporter NhaA [Candidatus Kapabacteria bacterium]